MLTEEEKKLILEVLVQINFKIGQSELSKKYEVIVEKLKAQE